MDSLRAEFAAAADEIFRQSGDIVIPATLRRSSGGAYDPVTGSTAGTTVDIPCGIVLDSWEQRQIDGDVVRVGDRRAFVRASELGIEPSTDDQLVIGGRTWQVLAVSTDPALVLYELHVR